MIRNFGFKHKIDLFRANLIENHWLIRPKFSFAARQRIELLNDQTA